MNMALYMTGVYTSMSNLRDVTMHQTGLILIYKVGGVTSLCVFIKVHVV